MSPSGCPAAAGAGRVKDAGVRPARAAGRARVDGRAGRLNAAGGVAAVAPPYCRFMPGYYARYADLVTPTHFQGVMAGGETLGLLPAASF